MKRSSIKRKRPRYPSPAQEQARREWAEGFDYCFICRRGSWQSHFQGVRLETHEIASRAQSSFWADPRNYLRTCAECHREILSCLPESIQCALKRLHDEANYDRSWINQARGEADTAISEADVKFWERFIEAIRG
jgi:hypothetical protein